MKYFLTTFFFLVLFKTFSQQTTCGNLQYDEMLEKQFPGRQKKIEKKMEENSRLRISNDISDSATIKIPVVVHIIYNTAKANISDERIFSQIQILNEDFGKRNRDTILTFPEFKQFSADTKFEFHLATRDPQGNVTNGIVRKKTNIPSFDGFRNYENDTLLKSISRWPIDQYLNIWVTTLTDKFLGYAYIPYCEDLDGGQAVDASLDGIVIHYAAFGKTDNQSSNNLGRTTTHEIGHWLGLLHLWGMGQCGTDYIADTPQQKTDNLKIGDDCIHYSTCSGNSSKDMSNNYMDYSPDKCMNMFTRDQKFRMRTLMYCNHLRQSILKSSAICYPGTKTVLPYFEGFEQDSISGRWLGEKNANLVVKFGGHNLSQQSKQVNAHKEKTIFITDPIDLLEKKDLVLEFSLAYLQGKTALVDSITISYNPDCKIFLPLYSLNKYELSDVFENNLSSDKLIWKDFSFPLNTIPGKKIIQIEIAFFLSDSNNIYIDDIRVYDKYAPLTLVLYPNPARNEVTAEIHSSGKDIQYFYLINSIGQLIRSYSFRSKDFKKILNLEGIPSGLYFIKAMSDEKSIVKKIVIEK